ncbi:MAG: sugar kinase [Bdellovibrionales bacterium]|nr:sugar kinase [Bdellovibrionales bacterium]
MSEILVVGSIAYDTITTPTGKADHALGGSANYFSLSASLYSRVRVVGVIGDDYAPSDLAKLENRDICTKGLQKVPGSTFHWEGKYEKDMNEAITLDTQLNVFENFNPELPEEYKDSKYVFLANIDPELQHRVLDQVQSPKLVGVDTMNFWIDSKIDDLKSLLKRVDVLLINEGEVRALANTWNTVAAIKELTNWGPRAVVMKRGEYGFMMYSEGQYFILPAYPVENVIDPTGAGDTFAGGFFGYLSKLNSDWKLEDVKQACIHGCLMASFTVQDFSVNALEKVDWPQVEKRQALYHKVIAHRD